MINLSNLQPTPGSTHARKRLGRGTSSGQGKTAGKGQKGQNSRAGGGVRVGFEGGQMPISRRLPKRGFCNVFAKNIAIVNVSDLDRFEADSIVDFNALKMFIREWKFDLLLRIEGLLVVLWVLFDTLKVRSKLMPLQEFADAALSLSELDGEAEQRYQKLENAIDMLSPAEDDQKLSTGDAELEGLDGKGQDRKKGKACFHLWLRAVTFQRLQI